MLFPDDEEAQRQHILARYDILDTPADPAFDRLTGVIASVFNVPIALVSLIDSHRQWFKSCIGMTTGETSLEVSFCKHLKTLGGPMIVYDAQQDTRFCDNPLVTGAPHIRFYAGAPLVTRDGYFLGSLCAIDTQPRDHVPDEAIDILRNLAGTAMDMIEYNHLNKQIGKARDEAERERRHLELVLENAGEGIYGMNQEGEITFANTTATRLLGYSLEEMLGVSQHELVHHNDRDGTPYRRDDCHIYKAITQGQRTYSEDEVFWRKDGRAIPVSYSSTPKYDADGDIQGAIVIFRDISRRKADEKALKDSEERYKLAVDGAAIGIWDWDIGKNALFVSPRFSDYAGIYNEIGDNTIDFGEFERRIHPEDQDYVAACIDNHLNYNSPYLVEFRYCKTDGEYIWVQASGQAMWDSDGQPYRMAGSVHDITQRKQAEAELRRARDENEKLAQAVAAANIGITIADATQDDMPLAYVNEAFLNMTGYTEDEVMGHNCRFLQGPDTDPEAIDTIREAIRKRESRSVEFVNYRKCGTPFWNILVISPVYNSQNELISFVGLQQDVTRRKQMEDELRSAHAEAERANRAKSDFLAGMSHEIRTPMNGIVGTASLMAETELTNKQKQYLNVISSSGKTLLTIINEILDFSKVDAGKLELQEQDFDLRQTIEDQVMLLQPLAAEKNLDYRLIFESELPEAIRGDSTRICQVITNLVGNAIKFTDQGGQVHIALTLSDEGLLQVEVRDTGIGLEESETQHIFDPFDQVNHDIHNSKTSGTGLGLAISKRIIEMMGGDIGVESTYGEGSIFWFRIPIVISEATGNQENPANPGEDVAIQEQFDAHILVAEDVATNQFVIMDILDNLGCRVDLAGNGREAVQAVRDTEYDIILMDCQMPVMNGYDATAEIREMNHHKRPLIIALTAYALEGDREKCLKAGMDDFIAKPVNSKDVANTLSRWLDDGHTGHDGYTAKRKNQEERKEYNE